MHRLQSEQRKQPGQGLSRSGACGFDVVRLGRDQYVDFVRHASDQAVTVERARGDRRLQQGRAAEVVDNERPSVVARAGRECTEAIGPCFGIGKAFPRGIIRRRCALATTCQRRCSGLEQKQIPAVALVRGEGLETEKVTGTEEGEGFRKACVRCGVCCLNEQHAFIDHERDYARVLRFVSRWPKIAPIIKE